MIDDSTQHIARISCGKDSLKMLDVIHSRGLPLDRITTTEVWATDTISANLPPMQKFKERMDQLRLLRRNYPDLWAILMRWDLDSPTTFKEDGHTVHDYDLRFQLEEEGKIPTGRAFRWEMLERPPKFVADEAEQMSLFWRDNG